jgi:hypothetical protein
VLSACALTTPRGHSGPGHPCIREEVNTLPPDDLIASREGTPSGLSDLERRALLGLAVTAISMACNVSMRAAAAQLDRAADRGGARIEGDHQTVTLTINGRALVTTTRADLRVLAARLRTTPKEHR